jgi:proteasome lid subunit RPN8/RPN11
MNAEIKAKVKEHALKDAPNEACGFICVNYLGQVTVLPCENLAKNKKGRFSIHPKMNAEAEKLGHIAAFYHSHASEFLDPAADKFSIEDIDTSFESAIPALLYVHPHDTWHYSQPMTYKPAELLGRPFVWGVWDCYTLVKDYYKIHKGVQLGHYFPPDNANLSSDFGYEGHISQENFREIPLEELQKDDVILLKIHSQFINHCLVYTGDNNFIHQPANKISSAGMLDDRYFKYISKVLRYNG